MHFSHQVAIIFAGTQGFIDDVPKDLVAGWERTLHKWLDEKHASIIEAIKKTKDLDKDNEDKLRKALTEFKEGWKAGSIKAEAAKIFAPAGH